MSSPTVRNNRFLPYLASGILLVVIAGSFVYSFPIIVALSVEHDQNTIHEALVAEFPVTVDPAHKLIVENSDVNTYLASPESPLSAAAVGGGNILKKFFIWIANAIASAPWYQSLAGADGKFVTITAGMRKEQVVSAFATALHWTKSEKTAFTTPDPTLNLPLTEGSYAPGTYFLPALATPADAQALINGRFIHDVLSHYGTTTMETVPLDQALNVAALIQRETISTDDMRLISGIIWNRIFANMDLQIDATLQYAKANKPSTTVWWPKVASADKYIKSPYNTYQHAGLPPTPIANPSVAAIVAALNPIKTSCLFYFNDKDGVFHCSDTYAEHVTLLKQFYGKGK